MEKGDRVDILNQTTEFDIAMNAEILEVGETISRVQTGRGIVVDVPNTRIVPFTGHSFTGCIGCETVPEDCRFLCGTDNAPDIEISYADLGKLNG